MKSNIYIKIKNNTKMSSILCIMVIFIISYFLFGCSDIGEKGDITLRINEYQIHNENTLRSSSWDTPDWIELYNYGDEDIWLGDKYLSEDFNNLQKYNLPNITIEAGSYLIVYASSQNDEIDNEIHANFKLSEDDGDLFLSTESIIIDTCKIDELSVDVSAGVNEYGKWAYFKTPTPGKENVGKGSKDVSIQSVAYEFLPIIINEYMSSNTYTLKDCFDESSDWIELYNPNDTVVNLSDYYISDDLSNCGKYRLPDYELLPDGYVLLYASGEIHSDDRGIHIPFSLGQNDENIVISSYTGEQIDRCILEPLPVDISAGVYEDGSWVYFASPTPDGKNDTEPSLSYNIAPNRVSDSPIVINEVMSNNQYGLLDMDGDTSDWIELYNPTDEDISLEGYALTDKEAELDKWLFPSETTIKAKSYLLVFLSDKNKQDAGELHASFALGDEDEKIMLIDTKGAVASYVDIEDMPGNVSKGRLQNDTYGYFPLPTPLGENTGRYEVELKADEDFMLTDIYISEVSAGQINYNQNSTGAFEEYIEIYNSSTENINLLGYTIGQDGEEAWTFPDVNINAKGYLTLLLKGSAEESYRVIDAQMSISSNGEKLVLKNSDGVIVDYFSTGFLPGNYSSGRVLDEGSRRFFFAEKTPNKKNSSDVYLSYCASPVFSEDGGMVDKDSILLTLSCKDGEEIRYTTDGKSPTEGSKKYTEPIYLEDDTVIRAACFAEGKLSSIVVSRTYIFEREHDLPIVCLSTSPVYLFGYTGGIFAEGSGYVESEPPYKGANFWKNWECQISFEYYDENNQLGLAFDAGLQVAGQYSRLYEQKSVVVRLRDEYGLDEIYYPFFEDSEVDYFKHILLRSSGQDLGYTKIKDYFIHQSVKDYTNVDIMEGRPVAVYINGDYWGLYNLREKQNEDYLASHYNIDKDDVTIIKSINEVLAGDITEWNDLCDFIKENNFSDDVLFSQLSEKVDVDTFIDYIIIQSFYGNYDMGNVKYWKDNNGGKWRPMLFDTDMALVSETSHLNYIEAYFRKSDYSIIFNALFENQGFKDAFVQRYAYFLNEVFTEDKLISLVDELTTQIDNEIVYQIGRYRAPQSYEKWQGNIAEFKETISTRRELSVEHLKSVFNLSDKEIEELFS